MTPTELIPLLDKGYVEELTLYYEGDKHVFRLCGDELMPNLPNYPIVKLWNSETGKGISALLADADNKCKYRITADLLEAYKQQDMCNAVLNISTNDLELMDRIIDLARERDRRIREAEFNADNKRCE